MEGGGSTTSPHTTPCLFPALPPVDPRRSILYPSISEHSDPVSFYPYNRCEKIIPKNALKLNFKGRCHFGGRGGLLSRVRTRLDA